MRERPILFSGAMVRAILEGRKTQTRRVVKDGPWNRVFRDAMTDAFPPPQYLATREDGTGRFLCCPYGQPGDRLWVRETWGWRMDAKSHPCIAFRADGSARLALAEFGGEGDFVGLGEIATPAVVGGEHWRPSIFMPRWASRLTLAVESVRVERLQDISEEDARAEGCEPCRVQDARGLGIFRDSFANLWNSINDARPGCSWEANPWVWVVGFSVAEARR